SRASTAQSSTSLTVSLISRCYPLPLVVFFFLLPRQPPTSTLFPYTTLFRSLLQEEVRRPVQRHRLAGRPGPLPRVAGRVVRVRLDRKSTRLNSSHDQISYAVFCLKKKKKTST